MPIYSIKNSNDEEITTVVADEDFVKTHYAERYEEVVFEPSPVPAEFVARTWRDSELEATDKAAQTPDWPNRDNILTYRAGLRDWPATDDFPDTPPTLGE